MRGPVHTLLAQVTTPDVSTRGLLVGGGVDMREPAQRDQTSVVNVARTARGILGLWDANVTLRPTDVRVFIFVLTRWMELIDWSPESDTALNQPAEFTLTELARWLRGGTEDPGGHDYDDVAAALSRLFDVEISGHYESVDQNGDYRRVRMRRSRLLSDLEIDAHLLREDADPAARARILGGSRGSTVRAHMSPWVLEQVRSGELVAVDTEILRQLGGLAERMWLVQVASLDLLAGDVSEMPIGEQLSRTLGMNYARRADALKALRSAARRILHIDRRFTAIETVNVAGEWRLRTTIDAAEVKRHADELQQRIDDRRQWARLKGRQIQLTLHTGGEEPMPE